MTLSVLKDFIRANAESIALAFGDDWNLSSTRRACIRFYMGAFKGNSAELIRLADMMN